MKKRFDLEAKTRRLDVDNRLPLKYYYRSADNILKQARIYRSENNILELYVLLLRFSSLVSETIPLHKEFQAGAFPRERQDFKQHLKATLDELESLQPQARRIIDKLNKEPVVQSLTGPLQQDGAWPAYALYETGSGLPNYQMYPSASDPMDLLTGPCYFPTSTQSSQENYLSHSTDSLSFNIPPPSEESRTRHSFLFQPARRTLSAPAQARVQYPSFIDASPVEVASLDSPWAPPPTVPSPPPPSAASAEPILWPEAEGLPTVPLPPLVEQLPIVHVAPDPPLIRQPSPPPMETPVQSIAAPTQLQPFEVADPEPGVGLPSEEGKGPKPLHISTKMMDEFMRLVSSNTKRNLETCAVLAGHLKRGKFFITTLILPKQQATSDSCQTLSEEEIFDVQDKRGLFQLGWIHTHPSQSCFMSSIDLHTHYSYQVMLQEAVAIVMAPTDQSRKFGIFRLTDPGGIKTIQTCDQRGFHPHRAPEGGQKIYDTCGHVFLNPRLEFDVIDLR